MKLLYITICFILLGLGIGYTDAIKSIEAWSNFYYLWDKTKDLLLVLCLYLLVKDKPLRSILILLSVFFTFRILWEFIVITTSYQVAASPEFTMLLFIGWAATIVIIMIKGIKEAWQQR